MSFNSIVFIWIFLPSVIVGYFLFSFGGLRRFQSVFLLLCSLIFYSWGDVLSLPFLLGIISIAWGSGIILDRISAYRKQILFIVVVLLISTLGYYKYCKFVVEQINYFFNLSIEIKSPHIPLGISFIIFQAIAYVVDVFRKDIQADTNWFSVALYMSFFPQLISGPIVRYSMVKNELHFRQVSIQKIKDGIYRFILGLGKKVIIADCLGYMVDTILAIDFSKWGSLFAWLVLIGYSLQIYYDFSGYSDMAVGLGKIFGFNFPENFSLPYISRSIKEFWRRWHMTLSFWFRDYLYIPLGGGRRGKYRTYINLLIVFFMTGLWHGANWNFIFWGLWNGFFIISERIWLGKWLSLKHMWIFSHMYTITVTFIGWMFFRIESLSEAFYLIKLVFVPTNMDPAVSMYYFVNPYIFFILIMGILFCGPAQYLYEKIRKCFKWQENSMVFYILKGIILAILLIYSLTQVVSSTYSGFIYQQF